MRRDAGPESAALDTEPRRTSWVRGRLARTSAPLAPPPWRSSSPPSGPPVTRNAAPPFRNMARRRAPSSAIAGRTHCRRLPPPQLDLAVRERYVGHPMAALTHRLALATRWPDIAMDTLPMTAARRPTTDAALVRRPIGAVRVARSSLACGSRVAEPGDRSLYCPDRIMTMARNTADTLWPVAFRRLAPALVQSLSEEDFARLCRLVRRRAKRRLPTSRHADDLVKRLKKRRSGAARMRRTVDLKRQNPRLLFARYRDNPILNSLHTRRSKLWIELIDRTESRDFSLKNFSFVDEPNKTMEILSDIAAAECTVITARIDFADERILDIGPYIVWGLISKDMAPVMIGGSIAPSVMKVLEAVRLRRFMGMDKL